MQISQKILFLIFLSALAACQPSAEKPEAELTEAADRFDPLSYVNPFIGTAGAGHTFPGATVPFGMVQVGPDTQTAGWPWCSGYQFADSSIAGFSHTHLSGTGIGDLGDILLMPAVGDPVWEENNPEKNFRSGFKKDSETASPGYYSVFLDKYRIFAELTATERTGLHRYFFPETDSAGLLIDLQHGINWDLAKATQIRRLNDSVLVGYRHSSGWAADQKLWFAAEFSAPILDLIFTEGTAVKKSAKDEITGKKSKVFVHFGKLPENKLTVRLALSPTGPEGALANLRAESSGRSFDEILAGAESFWRKELAKIEVKTPIEADKTKFYTALYHSMLGPTLFCDADGTYRNRAGELKKPAYKNYSTFSLWDSFRAQNPLMHIIHRQRSESVLKSILNRWEDNGKLPVWDLAGNETNTMIGRHSIPVLTDAVLKGIGNLDAEKVFAAARASSDPDPAAWKLYQNLGYFPADKVKESVSKTLEHAYDDYCISLLAERLGKVAEAEDFRHRAQAYRYVFSPEVGGFMHGKNSDGSWISPTLNPDEISHREGAYTEGTARQYSWFVPHDPEGLIEVMGGKAAFSEKLDALFSAESLNENDKSPDVSGLIGGYAQGNEPGHHIAYLYNRAGRPDKTRALVRRIIGEMYGTEPDGLCGNDDCGQLSSWLVFSALGFYPMQPAGGDYEIGELLFDEAVIRLENGREFKIGKTGSGTLSSVKLNGETVENFRFGFNDLSRGGELIFEYK